MKKEEKFDIIKFLIVLGIGYLCFVDVQPQKLFL